MLNVTLFGYLSMIFLIKMNVEIFGKRESSDACRSLGEFTFSGTGERF